MLGLRGDEEVKIDYTIIETGIVLDTETVETAAGTFEDCLKVEYRTETTAVITPNPEPGEVDPPRETVTTVWFAPNVGIVKYHRKMNYIFFDMIQDDDGIAKPPDPKPKTLELKKYEIKTTDFENVEKKSITTTKPPKDETQKEKPKTNDAQIPNYFPNTLDSFWVYEDQDGNELIRRAIEGEEIAGKTFSAFSYEPESEDWTKYSPFIHTSLYNVSDAGITLVVGDEVEKAVKTRLSKEMETFIEIVKNDEPTTDITYTIKVEAEEHFDLLMTPVTLNEEWDVIKIKANFELVVQDQVRGAIEFSIIETGIVQGTETVETPAGMFEDCLKVQYRTETTAVFNPPEELDPPGETVTTLWFAPDIGIVKFHQKSGHMFLDLIPDDFPIVIPPNKETTMELKKYKIKTTETESDESN